MSENDQFIQKRTETLPTNPDEKNMYEEFGASGGTRFLGSILNFKKGDFLTGQGGSTEVALGTKMVAGMNIMRHGWVHWVDNKPVDSDMGSMCLGFRPKKRPELGDMDSDMWPVDDTGTARDPWQETYHLPMMDADSNDVYTFVTSSEGGKNALKALSREYGPRIKKEPFSVPVVELSTEKYDHKVKTFGKIAVPVFKILGWTETIPDELLTDIEGNTPISLTGAPAGVKVIEHQAEQGDAAPVPQKPAAAPPVRQPAAPAQQRQAPRVVPSKTQAKNVKGKKKIHFR